MVLLDELVFRYYNIQIHMHQHPMGVCVLCVVCVHTCAGMHESVCVQEGV